jgi:glycosyltransferase involved in cell wall biosynthesis
MSDPWRFFPILALIALHAVSIIIGSAVYCEIAPHNSFYTFRPPVSIVVPNFEKARYLARALASAAYQTLTTIEIVIVDDYSRDNSMPVIASFLRRDPRARLVINQKPLKGHTTRALGVLESKGRFLLSLDSDDELFNQTAEIDLLAAQNHYADMVEHRALIVVPNGCIYPWNMPAKITDADNVTLVRLGMQLRLNWQLWLRLIERIVYFQGIMLVGQSRFLMQNARATDYLHNLAMYPFVHKCITVEYIGYKYYFSLPGNSFARCRHPKEEATRAVQTARRVLSPFIEADANLSQALHWTSNSITMPTRLR